MIVINERLERITVNLVGKRHFPEEWCAMFSLHITKPSMFPLLSLTH